VTKRRGSQPWPFNNLRKNRTAALREEIFDVPKTEAESAVHPHGVGDDLGWKAVSPIAGRLLAHLFSLPRGAQPDRAAAGPFLVTYCGAVSAFSATRSPASMTGIE
jgi:hypothetical protein